MLKTFLQITKISTLVDGSCRVTANTPEMTPEAMTELFKLKKEGQVAAIFKGAGSNTVELKELPYEGKSPSERLRGVLYRLHEQKNYPTPFNAWYADEMERIISHFKSKLN